MNLLDEIRGLFAEALRGMADRPAEYALLVKPAQDAKFGDYQANCAMPLAKHLGRKPRDVAQEIIDRLPDKSLFSKIEIAGPGFINLRIDDAAMAAQLQKLLGDEKLGVTAPEKTSTVVVDFSGPNVAKPMHVGHLRSTIIGDALARIFRALGWRVVADNHLGDWGTQFGMLIYGWRNHRDDALAAEKPIAELARLYRLVNELASKDEAVAAAARIETAKLHEGDPENVALWNTFMPWCLEDLHRIYERLDIAFDHHYGESFYQPLLEGTVQELLDERIAEVSQGAICVFFPDPTGKLDEEGQPVALLPPAIIRKGDGAFTYATSDLACIRYRTEHFRPDVVLYVVDDRQTLHFQQIFEAARRWGYDHVELRHIAFGKITDAQGRPYKTREGGTVGLEPLLDEAVARARKVVDENSAELPEEERRRIAEVVGIGAVKYADLSQNRTSDYVFDWDKMISLNGNTAAYLQYAYARNRSIFRRGEVDPNSLAADPPQVQLGHACERALGLALLQFPEALAQTAADCKPNLLTTYLFELANVYSGFFRDCPVLKAESDSLKQSRLALCELTARTLQKGLSLLGIRTAERM